VLVTATVSLTVVAAVFLSNPWMGARLGSSSRPAIARRHLASEIDVWVGELAPNLKAVLRPVWGEAAADLAHDQTLNDDLELGGDEGLAFYRLLIFNLGEETRTVPLGAGALEIRLAPPRPPVALQSVADLVAAGRISPSPAMQAVLEGQGTLRRSVEIPAGRMADLLVAFEQRVALGDATEVRGTDGVAFARRPMSRGDLEALVEVPDAKRIREL
jgi:hypothetical protein